MNHAAKHTPSDSPQLLSERARRMAEDRAEDARLPPELRALNPSALLNPIKPPSGAVLAPEPPGALPLLGHARAISLGQGSKSLDKFVELRENHGDVVRLRFASLTVHLVSSPDLIRQVLHEKHRIYTKETRGIYKMRLVLGNGLVTSQGPSWLQNRRIAQPAFAKKRIAGFAETMAKSSQDMVDAWTEGDTIDIHQEMMRVTLRIIGQTMLSADVTDEAERVGEAVSHVIDDINRRVNSIMDIPQQIPTLRNREFQKAMDTLDEVVLGTIEERRVGEPKNDLLQMFMESVDADTGETMDDAQLRDEVMTIFLAGHETTANALTWALYLLSKNPGVARSVREEVRNVAGDESITAAHTRELDLTKRVLQEAMRLYPPVWMTARSPNVDDTLGGYHIPKGSLVLTSPYVAHRHPDHWEDPEGFDPDRFLEENSKGRHRFAYFPFGGGPRICIGNHFAMMEAQIILATILRNNRLDLVPGANVEMEPVITLRPKDGMRMRPFAVENTADSSVVPVKAETPTEAT
jgi:cytochrome P450